MLKEYLQRIFAIAKRGDAREESFYFTGRTNSPEDIRHYCRVVTALSKTIAAQAEIDALYPQIEKHILIVEDKS
ncbi:MAG: hypothetical protein ACE5I9_00750 [Candidatus Methylomirabilales bacterium]